MITLIITYVETYVICNNKKFISDNEFVYYSEKDIRNPSRICFDEIRMRKKREERKFLSCQINTVVVEMI